MTVTVCVPAYRAGAFLADTLASALAQTYADCLVDVGVDPCEHDGSGDEHDTLRALAPFRADPRVRVHLNAQRLGWDGNVRALLRRVDTPWLAILPHDDVWEPKYLEALVADLRADPDAVVAYADLLTFGAGAPTRKAVAVPNAGSRRAQWLAFLLQGAEAMPWRGVTRADQLARIGEFPVDGHRGFAVECEYAYALLLAGRARHRPEALYRKRLHPEDAVSASRTRLLAPPDQLREAWRAHAARMEVLLEAGLRDAAARVDADAIPDTVLRAALAAAMGRRFQLAVAPRLDDAEAARLEDWLADLRALPVHATQAVRACLLAVLARHAGGNALASTQAMQACRALRADPHHVEAWLLLAETLAADERLDDARACLAHVEAFAPGLAQTQVLRARLPRQSIRPPTHGPDADAAWRLAGLVPRARAGA
jgi:hypothetical protein